MKVRNAPQETCRDKTCKWIDVLLQNFQDCSLYFAWINQDEWKKFCEPMSRQEPKCDWQISLFCG